MTTFIPIAALSGMLKLIPLFLNELSNYAHTKILILSYENICKKLNVIEPFLNCGTGFYPVAFICLQVKSTPPAWYA